MPADNETRAGAEPDEPDEPEVPASKSLSITSTYSPIPLAVKSTKPPLHPNNEPQLALDVNTTPVEGPGPSENTTLFSVIPIAFNFTHVALFENNEEEIPTLTV